MQDILESRCLLWCAPSSLHGLFHCRADSCGLTAAWFRLQALAHAVAVNQVLGQLVACPKWTQGLCQITGGWSLITGTTDCGPGGHGAGADQLLCGARSWSSWLYRVMTVWGWCQPTGRRNSSRSQRSPRLVSVHWQLIKACFNDLGEDSKMVLASTSVFIVKQALKNGCQQCLYVSRENLSHFLPLQEAL